MVELLREHGGEASSRMLASTLMLEAGSSPAAVRATLARAGQSDKRAPLLKTSLAELGKRAASVKATRKSKALLDLVRAHPDQVLVFTRFRETLAELERTAADAGLSPLTFHGGHDAATKQAMLARFREGGKLMLATDVGGEGQNHHHCHVLVNFDLPYNPMLIEQRIGRLHRMGQREEVRVYNLCAKGTAEERVLDLLDRRLHFAALVAEARAPRRKTEPQAVEAKVAHLLAERDKKLGDLHERFAVRVRASAAAAVWAEIPAAQVEVKLKRRKEARAIVLRVPSGAHAVDRLACEGCGAPTARPAACDDRLHLLCEVCAPSAQGRIACPACARRR